MLSKHEKKELGNWNEMNLLFTARQTEKPTGDSITRRLTEPMIHYGPRLSSLPAPASRAMNALGGDALALPLARKALPRACDAELIRPGGFPPGRGRRDSRMATRRTARSCRCAKGPSRWRRHGSLPERNGRKGRWPWRG